LAALADRDWLQQTVRRIDASRARIAQIARDCGLEPLPSAANFVAVDCGRDGAFAKAVLDGLVERGVFVRMPFAAPQNRCIRVSCGTEEQLDLLAAVLPQALRAAEKS
jgi:histidinol-phosphate aminotransferase